MAQLKVSFQNSLKLNNMSQINIIMCALFNSITTGPHLCHNPVCVWRSCGPQPPLPPSAPPGSPGYSGRQPPAPAPLRDRRTGCGAAAEAVAEEARTKRPERPGTATAARWGPLPRAGERSGGSRSVPNRIQSPAVASEGGYCPG